MFPYSSRHSCTYWVPWMNAKNRRVQFLSIIKSVSICSCTRNWADFGKLHTPRAYGFVGPAAPTAASDRKPFADGAAPAAGEDPVAKSQATASASASGEPSRAQLLALCHYCLIHLGDLCMHLFLSSLIYLLTSRGQRQWRPSVWCLTTRMSSNYPEKREADYLNDLRPALR